MWTGYVTNYRCKNQVELVMSLFTKLFSRSGRSSLTEQRAHEGIAIAQYNLGRMYSNGLSVSQDHVKAYEWMSKAAHQGLSEAQHMLGYMYANGLGVEKNHLRAEEWFRKASK